MTSTITNSLHLIHDGSQQIAAAITTDRSIVADLDDNALVLIAYLLRNDDAGKLVIAECRRREESGRQFARILTVLAADSLGA